MKVADVYPEGGGRGAVNQPQPDRAAPLDAEDLRVGEGTVIGQIGIVFDIVDVHRHAARRCLGRVMAHSVTAMPAHSGPSGQSGKQFFRALEAEVVKQDHDLLLVERGLGGIPDDQWRGQKLLLLQRMGVHPVCAGRGDGEAVVIGLAGSQKSLRQVRHAVLPERRRQAVPVNEGRRVERILQPHGEILPGFERDPVAAVRLEQAEH